MAMDRVLGLDLGGTSIKWGVVNEEGGLLRSGEEPITDRAPRAVLDRILSVVEQAAGGEAEPFCALGIGSPGLIDAKRQVVRLSPNFPEWRDVPLVSLVREKLGKAVPVFLENDANLLVFSETRWGAAVGLRHVVVLTLGTGVGGGVLVDGRLLVGSGGGAAELGHTPIDRGGPLCGCGARGCLEVYCNIAGTMRTARRVYQPEDPPESPAELTRNADDGDERALSAWREVGHALGVGVAGLVNVFNPQAVLIGGGLVRAGHHLLAPAEEMAKQRAYSANWRDMIFRQAGLETRAGLLGAAALAFERLAGEAG